MYPIQMPSSRLAVALSVCYLLCSHIPVVQGKSAEAFVAHMQEVMVAKDTEDWERLAPQLWHYYLHPIVLNHARAADLVALHLLESRQIDALLIYNKRHGSLHSIEELQCVPHWDVATIMLVRPFVSVEQSIWKRWWEQGLKPPKQKFTYYLHRGSVKDKKVYWGTPVKCFIRYQVHQPNFYRIGVLSVKDVHEPLWHPQLSTSEALNRWTIYGVLEHVGYLKQLVLGDYEVGFGQGVVTSLVFTSNIKTEVINCFRTSQGIKHTTSKMRKAGLRGIAVVLGTGGYTLTTYASRRYLDVTLHEPSDGSSGYVESISNRGIAYTHQGAINKKDQLKEQILGAALTYSDTKGKVNIGLQGLYVQYDHLLDLGKKLPHNHFFCGKHNANLSVFGDLLWHSTHFFGEVACSQNGGLGALGGSIFSLHKRLDVACLLYSYQPHFHSLYGKTFRIQSYNRNKEGIYLGLSYSPKHKLFIKGSLDMYRKLVVERLLHSAPAHRLSHIVVVSYEPTRQYSTSLKCESNYQQVKAPKSSFGAPIAMWQYTHTFKAKVAYQLSKHVKGTSVIQGGRYQRFNLPPRYGVGMHQVLTYQRERLRLKGWLTCYATPPHKFAAIYFNGHDLGNPFSYPACNGQGMRLGLLVKYPLSRQVTWQARCLVALRKRITKDNTPVQQQQFVFSMQLVYSL